MPPIGGAGRLAASTKYALVETIEQLALFNTLQVLLLLGSNDLLPLEVRFNRLVLCIKVGHVNDEILEHKHKHQR